MMKRAVMRCRANYSGQAWPKPSDRSGVATRFIAKIFPVQISSPRHHDSSLEAARPIQSDPTRSSPLAASDPLKD